MFIMLVHDALISANFKNETLIGFEAKKFLLEKIYQHNITGLKNLQLKNNLCRYFIEI